MRYSFPYLRLPLLPVHQSVFVTVNKARIYLATGIKCVLFSKEFRTEHTEVYKLEAKFFLRSFIPHLFHVRITISVLLSCAFFRGTLTFPIFMSIRRSEVYNGAAAAVQHQQKASLRV